MIDVTKNRYVFATFMLISVVVSSVVLGLFLCLFAYFCALPIDWSLPVYPFEPQERFAFGLTFFCLVLFWFGMLGVYD